MSPTSYQTAPPRIVILPEALRAVNADATGSTRRGAVTGRPRQTRRARRSRRPPAAHAEKRNPRKPRIPPAFWLFRLAAVVYLGGGCARLRDTSAPRLPRSGHEID